MPQRSVQFRHRYFSQPLCEQLVFEPIEFTFPCRPKWRSRCQPLSKSRFGNEPCRLPFLIFVYVFHFACRFWVKNQNPAIDWQSRGFLKNLLFCLEFHSHDAQIKTLAQPNGHAFIGLHMLQSRCDHGFHFYRRKETPLRGICQRFFNGKNKISKTCRTARQW
jgi:hypothetical protein